MKRNSEIIIQKIKPDNKKNNSTALRFLLSLLFIILIPVIGIAQDEISLEVPGEIYEFHLNRVNNPEVNKVYEDSILIHIDKKLKPSRLELIFPINDYTKVLIPKNNDMIPDCYDVGLITQRWNISYDWQIGLMKVDLSQADLSKPINIEFHLKSIIGKAQINEVIRAIVYEKETIDGTSVIVFKRTKKIQAFLYNLMLGMIIIACLYFLIHFFIMKRKYFFAYSIYLFFLVFNYGYRTPEFYYFYSQLDPYAYIYIDVNSQTLAFLSYTLFLSHFLNIDQQFIKTKIWFNILSIALGCTLIFENILLFSSLQGKFFAIDYDKVFIFIKSGLVIVSFGLIAHLIKNKKTPFNLIALIGSILLLLGYVLCMLFKNYIIIMTVVVAETMIFMGIISYLHINSVKASLEENRKNQKLKESEEMLKGANQSKEEIITELSHRFRTPLSIILFQVQEKLKNKNLSISERKTYDIIYKYLVELSKGVDDVINQYDSDDTLTRIESEYFLQNKESEACPIKQKINDLCLGKKSILLVEDNNCLRHYLSFFLKNEGYKVIEAENGIDGIKKALDYQPDLIISDIMMPESEKDGIALVKELKNHQLTKFTPIILLTAKASDKDKILGIKSFADGYLTKPIVNMDLLTTEIKKHLYTREVLWRSIFNIELSNYTSYVADFLEQLQEIFAKNLKEPSFNASKLFELTSFPNQKKLQRMIKEIFGVPPNALINIARLEISKIYLKRDQFMSIQEIAFELGYNDANYFSNCFKKRFNCRPSQYRDQFIS
ncbi:response regulator [Aquimarina latercula]|uniref:response regulator n=1 Tax=Aquimarina latercula TaxID=987 RepID=UPI00041910F3|nr:response regulator [Aquimarina latercula]